MTRYAIAGGVLRADLAGEEVFLNPKTGVYHLVNATGRRLIAEMDAGRSFEDSIRTLADEAGEPKDRVERDAHAFVQAMLGRRLLESVE